MMKNNILIKFHILQSKVTNELPTFEFSGFYPIQAVFLLSNLLFN